MSISSFPQRRSMRDAALATQAARQERHLSVQRKGAGQGLSGKDAGGDRGGRHSLPARYPKEWVAHCKSVGSGEKALIYLGRYLYRGVIREADILACENGQVSFRYRNAQTGKSEKRSLAGADFLWLILQHVLPKGFRRARNFGFLHANCKRLIALLHLLLKFDPSRFAPPRKERPAMLCPCCGAVMVIVRTRIRSTAPGVITVAPLAAVAI
jgi:hypothetical protein